MVNPTAHKLGVAMLILLLGLIALSSTGVFASHNALINARVSETVDLQGAKVTINTDDPGTLDEGTWSYTRVTVNYDATLDSNNESHECASGVHCYGEVGPYEEEAADGDIVPLVVYQNKNGRFQQKFSSTLLTAGGTSETWKVVNNKTCGDVPTTLDVNWDACLGTTKLGTYGLDFDLGTSMDSGAEVSGHGVEMMESWHTLNKYIDDSSSNWTATSDVNCIDGTYNSSTDICTVDDDDDYRVTWLQEGNDSQWKTDYNP